MYQKFGSFELGIATEFMNDSCTEVVTNQTFGLAEFLLFGSVKMTEPISAEHRN